ncbi:phage portal protein [Micromonospora sp. WMMD961]|uniref:phage portal protein n=1 Tax=Micromonospora sp. WMMD961 TaxID=3016100 RepID=UPI0024179C68|nr:phage portal protein [Micromonospora sp. WMMD961]MDG4783258.1 phage portal protein [Micromonospora sp. WMMD961]
MATSPAGLAKQLLAILHKDLDALQRIDDYLQGAHDDPYMPENCSDEYKLLARRCVSNWMPLLVGTPAQAMYVDSFRRGNQSERPKDGVLPEWRHWQESRLDARQIAVHRGALAYGHSFTVTEKLRNGKIRTKGLSAMRTSAVFEDPANDHVPYAALTVTRFPQGEEDRGKARMWDGTREYAVIFKSLGDNEGVTVKKVKAHGAKECPVTRFAAAVDLEGRTCGVIGPMIELQNRINQSVFDLLVAQTYSSTKVRTATGMAPPLERDENGEIKLDEKGQPIPLPVNVNASRFLFAEDDTVKFDTLDETPLGGFIESIDMSIRHLSALSQTPPHHLLGQIANLSAEALLAAETALARKIEEFRKSFGESWERVFRLAAEMEGITASAEDYSGEVLWRDMEQRSLAQAADALGKLREQLQIPARGLWPRVPNATKNELDEWERIVKEDDLERQFTEALHRAGGERSGDRERVPA